MEKTINVGLFKEIIANFPSTTKTLHTHKGVLFTFDSFHMCFCKSPFKGITFTFDFKVLNKILDSFDSDEDLEIENSEGKIVFKNKNTSLDMSSAEETPKKMAEKIQEILNTELKYHINSRENLKESILFACSVARKDNLSGMLDHIVLTKSGEIISSDNIRALRIQTEENPPVELTMDAKRSQYFFKNKDVSKILISENWIALFEKSTKMYFCMPVPSTSMGKFPTTKFKEFFKANASANGNMFKFPEEAKALLRKVSHFAEGKNEISKTVSLEFKKKKIICSVLIPGGIFIREVSCKNTTEFRMTLNPGLFISPNEDIEFKFLQNAIYYKKDNFEYIMAVGE